MALVGTPGLTTTKSIWSKSHDGGSPATWPTPSVFKASASGDHSVSGLRSLSATIAPRCARNGALAMPLRAAPAPRFWRSAAQLRSEEHTSELQSRGHLVCRLLLEKKKIK